MNYIENLINNNKELEYLTEPITEAVEYIKSIYFNQNKIMICGNGGSCSDSDHIVGELMKGFLLKREITKEERDTILKNNYENSDFLINSLQRGIGAISLNNHNALNSAIINDVSADMTYAQQVFSIGKKGDLLIGISTSGNAENVCNALKIAKSFGIKTMAMTGNRNGKMNQYSDIIIDVPSSETYRIQEYHIMIYHAFCAQVEKELFG